LTKAIELHGRDYANRLHEVAREYNTTWKTATDFTPCEFIYGKRIMFPIEFECKTLRIASNLNMDLSMSQKDKIH
jgi:hypothetical protein